MVQQLVPAALLAALISYLLTPVARFAVQKAGVLAYPSSRRIHLQPIPQGVGVAIFAAFWLTVGLTGDTLAGFNLGSLFLGSLVIVLLGLVDDRFELSAVIKFTGQVGAAILVVALGHRVDFLTNPFGGMVYLGLWGPPLTVLWIVAVTNMVNLIDGLDGLAAGVSGIAGVSLSLVALHAGRPGFALLTLILAGSAFGFLPHNYNPARVFMGDTGAMFLGFMLGVITVDGALKGAAAIALTVPFLALGVPAFDFVFTIIRRTVAGRPFYEADQGHLHHQLLAMGLSQRQVVAVLYGVSGLLGAAALWVAGLPRWEGLLLFALVTAIIGVAGRRVGVLGGFRQSPVQEGTGRQA